MYAVIDSVPEPYMDEFAQRLHARTVEPGGRLVVGHYGSRSRETPPLPVAEILESAGLAVAGEAWGGDLPLTRFAWVDKR